MVVPRLSLCFKGIVRAEIRGKGWWIEVYIEGFIILTSSFYMTTRVITCSFSCGAGSTTSLLLWSILGCFEQ